MRDNWSVTYKGIRLVATGIKGLVKQMKEMDNG